MKGFPKQQRASRRQVFIAFLKHPQLWPPHPQITAYMGCFAPLPPSSLETKLSSLPSSSSSSLHHNFPPCNQNSSFSTKQELLLLSHSHLQQTIIHRLVSNFWLLQIQLVWTFMGKSVWTKTVFLSSKHPEVEPLDCYTRCVFIRNHWNGCIHFISYQTCVSSGCSISLPTHGIVSFFWVWYYCFLKKRF